jgi:hypothetical protein
MALAENEMQVNARLGRGKVDANRGSMSKRRIARILDRSWTVGVIWFLGLVRSMSMSM